MCLLLHQAWSADGRSYIIRFFYFFIYTQTACHTQDKVPRGMTKQHTINIKYKLGMVYTKSPQKKINMRSKTVITCKQKFVNPSLDSLLIRQFKSKRGCNKSTTNMKYC